MFIKEIDLAEFCISQRWHVFLTETVPYRVLESHQPTICPGLAKWLYLAVEASSQPNDFGII